jgi:hypothetical protein
MAEHGDMIFYDDHQAALKQAKIDAVREFGEWLDNRDVLEGEYYCYGQYADDFIEQLKEQRRD